MFSPTAIRLSGETQQMKILTRRKQLTGVKGRGGTASSCEARALHGNTLTSDRDAVAIASPKHCQAALKTFGPRE